MTKIIGNCVSILVLSSALPVMSRTLGITRFDLLGDFGRFNWLGNFYIVLSYNLLFAIVTTLCLVRKFTSAVREELFKALGLHKLHLSNTSRDSEPTKPSANGHQKALWDLRWPLWRAPDSHSRHHGSAFLLTRCRARAWASQCRVFLNLLRTWLLLFLF